MLLRNSLFSFLRLRRMQSGSLSSHLPSHASSQDKHPPQILACIWTRGPAWHGPHALLLQTDSWRYPFSPHQSPCLPPPPAFLLQVRTKTQGVISAFEMFACVVVVPFIHTCAQIPICLATQPFGREFCQPAHLRVRALQGQNCLCLCHCLRCRPGGAQALQVCGLFGCVRNASCILWCVCVTFQTKPVLLKCEHSPLLMEDLGAGGRGHLSECSMYTCMYVFHFLADLC